MSISTGYFFSMIGTDFLDFVLGVSLLSSLSGDRIDKAAKVASFSLLEGVVRCANVTV